MRLKKTNKEITKKEKLDKVQKLKHQRFIIVAQREWDETEESLGMANMVVERREGSLHNKLI